MTDGKYDSFVAVPLAFFFIIGLSSVRAFSSALAEAREAEVKYNCHEIQLALEKYALYNGLQYPSYLFGGDKDSWDPDSERACQAILQPHRKPPVDPLIAGGYLSSYPRNPFITPGKGTCETIFQTGGTYKSGWGDIRFGYDGEIMGNCLNDPLKLWSGEIFATTDFASTMVRSIGTESNYIGMVQMNTPVNPFYAMGGLPLWSQTEIGKSTGEGWLNCFWPGEFFYRAGGMPQPREYVDNESTFTLWDFQPEIIDQYLLGGYGSSQTKGIDCIRLTTKDGQPANNMRGWLNEQYEVNPDYGWAVYMSTPEVFGGGEKGRNPMFPYLDADGDWIYGAPDGYPDGIIILLIPGGSLDEIR